MKNNVYSVLIALTLGFGSIACSRDELVGSPAPIIEYVKMSPTKLIFSNRGPNQEQELEARGWFLDDYSILQVYDLHQVSRSKLLIREGGGQVVDVHFAHKSDVLNEYFTSDFARNFEIMGVSEYTVPHDLSFL